MAAESFQKRGHIIAGPRHRRFPDPYFFTRCEIVQKLLPQKAQAFWLALAKRIGFDLSLMTEGVVKQVIGCFVDDKLKVWPFSR